jgi:hypothetical protein
MYILGVIVRNKETYVFQFGVMEVKSMKRNLLVSIWRCGGKLYRSYTDGSLEVIEL